MLVNLKRKKEILTIFQLEPDLIKNLKNMCQIFKNQQIFKTIKNIET